MQKKVILCKVILYLKNVLKMQLGELCVGKCYVVIGIVWVLT